MIKNHLSREIAGFGSSEMITTFSFLVWFIAMMWKLSIHYIPLWFIRMLKSYGQMKLSFGVLVIES
jgi:hypothetical protein